MRGSRRAFSRTWMMQVNSEIVMVVRRVMMGRLATSEEEAEEPDLGWLIDTLFVANLSDSTSRSWLMVTFRRWGPVTDAFIPKTKDAVGRIFGFVRMASSRQAEKTMTTLNGHVMQGWKLLVNLARFKRKVISGQSRSPLSDRVFKTNPVITNNQEFLNKICFESGTRRR